MIIGCDMRFSAKLHMGTGVYAEKAIRDLAAAISRDDVLVLFGSENVRELRIGGPKVRYVNVPKASNDIASRLLWDSAICNANLDVFFAPTGLAPMVKNCPVVVTIHDLYFEHNDEDFEPALHRFLKREIKRSAFAADRIIAISDTTRDDIIKTYDIDTAKVVTIKQSLRESFNIVPKNSQIKSTLKHLGIRSPYLMTLSNHAPHKNTEFVLRVFDRWTRDHPARRHNLVVAGGGTGPMAASNLAVLSASLGIDRRIFNVGRIADDMLTALLAGADAFLFASKSEGWGLPPLESISMGTPVIVSNCGALSEAIGSSGTILPLDNPIAWTHEIEILLNDRKKYAKAMESRRLELLQPQGNAILECLKDAIKQKPEIVSAEKNANAKISGCTIVRNAIALGYPLKESIQSYLPICDQVVLLWDPTSEDDTRGLVNQLAGKHSKIKLVESVWNLNNRSGGTEIARQTQNAFAQCDCSWTLYIQADEALHEDGYNELLKCVNDKSINAVTFARHSFLRTLTDEIIDHRVDGLVRMFRTGMGKSVGDAMQCEVSESIGKTARSSAKLFNYSRLGAAAEIFRRCNNLRRFYHDDSTIAALPSDHDTSLKTEHFLGTHPAPIEAQYRTAVASVINAGFSIIIPSYNDLPYLKLLLKSIRDYSAMQHQVIVVSDGSDDGSREYLQKLKGITYRHRVDNMGICTTTNEAASLATRQWLFFANSDMVVGPGWDSALFAQLDEKTVVASTCIEPGLVNVASVFHTMDCGRDAESFNWERFEQAVNDLSERRLEEGVQYPFAVSRSLWEQSGGLDTAFDPGPFSDPDVFYRLCLSGAKFLRTRASLLYHFSGVTLRRRTPERWKESEHKNIQTFWNKWGEFPRYVFGSKVEPGEAARSRAKSKKPNITALVMQGSVQPMVSVHIVARETDEFGTLMFASCLESLQGYADEIIVVDNGLCDGSRQLVSSMKAGLPIRIIDGREIQTFSELRNLALGATSENATHVHKVDTDEVYLPQSLEELKNLLRDSSVRCGGASLIHFMIEPTLVESIQKKAVIFRRLPGLSWKGAAHEGISGTNDADASQTPASFLHFGYCRPQWQILLKWLHYAFLQTGSLSPYKYEFVDGVKLPWFRGGRSPDTILEPRRAGLERYKGSYPQSIKFWLESFASSRKTWREWVGVKTDSGMWDKWQALYEKYGHWEDTLDEIFEMEFGRNTERAKA